jgi:UDP-N-acetylmuramoyl-tripeptide--D-alanyl-D-alanine ligase
MLELGAEAAVGRFFEVAEADIRAALAAYAPTNNRSQLAYQAATGNHLTLDAYNANPSSVGAAVRHFATLPATDAAGQQLPKLLILGDMLELGAEAAGEHRRLGALLHELGYTDVVLIGPEMAAAVTELPHAHHFVTKADAAAWLTAHPPRNRRILLKGSRGIGLETLLELL